jgi:hypothetical protein
MSARLGLNEIRYFSWKDKTFYQITSVLQKNNKLNTSPFKSSTLRNPLPLKIYRREIANIDTSIKSTSNTCSRFSSRISDFERPNGYFIFSNPSKSGLKNTLNECAVRDNPNRFLAKYTTGSSTQIQGYNTVYNCISNQSKALSRCRSAGMVPRKFNLAKNNDQYCTSTSQYLISRNLSFNQNQYNYLKQGSKSVKPGSANAQNNVYSAQGINHCSGDKKYTPVIYKPNNSQFAQQGGVSSSALTARVKYDTITTTGSSYYKPFGSHVANALAYGGPDTGYTIKNRIGFPSAKIPIFSKYDGSMQCASKDCYRSKR